MSARADEADRPILVVPFQWIGDFVRAHTAVRLLASRFPGRPIDIVATPLCAPLTRFMPGVRSAVVRPHVRGRFQLVAEWAFAKRLREHGYGRAIVMPGTLKSAVAPFLARIPKRTGWRGEMRYGLLNDLRNGEYGHAHIGVRCGLLALPAGASAPRDLPPPQLIVPEAEIAGWRQRAGIGRNHRPVIALAPGSNGPERRWPVERYAELAALAALADYAVWVMGGPAEAEMANVIRAALPAGALDDFRDFTDTDLADAVCQASAADVFVGNDSGLLHLAAATGTPCIAVYLASFHDRTGPFNENVVPMRAEPGASLDADDVFAQLAALVPQTQ